MGLLDFGQARAPDLTPVKAVGGTFRYGSGYPDGVVAKPRRSMNDFREDMMRGIGQRLACSMAFFLLAGAGAAHAQGDPEKGEKVFNKCKVCHNVEEKKNKLGPYLVGIFGRPAGSVEGFKYSDAMKTSGIVWEDDTLAAYLKDPKGYIPGNRMAFAGLRKDDDIADLLAYLHEETSD
jgi:cytochrome c